MLLRWYLLFISFLNFYNIISTAEIQEDAYLTTPELLTKYGYPHETHQIITSDGYNLSVHRLVKHGKQPVLLMHGLLDSSATWILMGTERGFAYILFDAGYDVWLTNARANIYSRNHVKYKPSDKNFWMFSWHEIGKFDLPPTIDYILEKTNYSRCHYIGHSQGTTAFFVMMSELPHYNEKIALMTALAPIVFMTHIDNEPAKMFAKYVNLFERVRMRLGFYEFSTTSNAMIKFFKRLSCKIVNLSSFDFCNENFSSFYGNYSNHINTTMLPVISRHVPAGAAVKQIIHFSQLIKYQRFAQFDYGIKQNLNKYHQMQPPEYVLKNCKIPVVLFYANVDVMADPADVEKLAQTLPNVLSIQHLSDKTFNHVDFVWGTDANSLIYEPAIKFMKSIENKY